LQSTCLPRPRAPRAPRTIHPKLYHSPGHPVWGGRSNASCGGLQAILSRNWREGARRKMWAPATNPPSHHHPVCRSASMSRTHLARSAGLVMGLILISRLLGFIRERAIAEVFGRTWETDAFRAAFNIPDLMYVLLVGGAISAAFLPVFTEYLAKGEEEEAWRLGSTFMTGAGAFLVAFAAVGAALAPALVPLVAYGRERDEE